MPDVESTNMNTINTPWGPAVPYNSIGNHWCQVPQWGSL